jgi:hypothetical protein
MAEKKEIKSENLLWTARIAREADKLRLLQKIERSQFRTDAKAIMCRGDLEAADVSRI